MSTVQPHGTAAPLLAAQGIVKNFGHIHALRGVDFHVNRGETVGLVGDNGAGKSTLLKILCGVYRPDGGTIMVDGAAVTFHSARDALDAGIAVVYQDLALVDMRDVAANIFLGREPGNLFVSRREMRRQAATVLADLNIAVPSVRTLVGNLSGGQRQAVAIARAIHMGGRLVIMDEPTAALGVEGQRKVLRLIADLKAQGKSVIVVSHNLEHVFSVSDRIVVLRNGRVAGERLQTQTTPEEIVRLMNGPSGRTPTRRALLRQPCCRCRSIRAIRPTPTIPVPRLSMPATSPPSSSARAASAMPKDLLARAAPAHDRGPG